MAKSGRILCGYRSAPGGPRRLELAGPGRRPPLTKRLGYELLVATVTALRKSAPCAYPVVVRSGGVPDTMDGFCIRRRARFVIHLGEFLSPSNAVAVVVHEWAHARAWNHCLDRAARDVAEGGISAREFDAVCHGAAFGVEYAHCWRVFTGEVLPAFQQARAG